MVRGRRLSYLMPAHFQYWGRRFDKQPIAPTANPNFSVSAKAVPDFFEVQAQDYKSKVTLVGNPGQKIAVADGTRYMD